MNIYPNNHLDPHLDGSKIKVYLDMFAVA